MKQERKKVRGIFEKVHGSNVWWIRYTDASGGYRRELAGTWSQASKLLVKRRNQTLVGRKLPETLRRRTVTFSEIADDALIYSKAHKRSYRDDCSHVKRLKEWFGSSAAESFSGHDMEMRLTEIASAEKWQPSTFNHYRSLLMLCFREARRAEKVVSNPARDIRHRKEDNNRVRYLTRGEQGEYERLKKVIGQQYPEHLGEFVFSVNTGLRLGSQYGATYEMIDWTRNVLDIPRTKNDDPVHVPLNSNALAAMRSLPSWQECREERKGPIFRSQRHPEKPVLSNDHWFKPALKAAAVGGYKWHDNRHTFASWLVQDGVPLDRIAKLLGHSPKTGIAMTMRYAHLAPNQLHEDVERLTAKSVSTTAAPEPKQESSVSVRYVN